MVLAFYIHTIKLLHLNSKIPIKLFFSRCPVVRGNQPSSISELYAAFIYQRLQLNKVLQTEAKRFCSLTGDLPHSQRNSEVVQLKTNNSNMSKLSLSHIHTKQSRTCRFGGVASRWLSIYCSFKWNPGHSGGLLLKQTSW